MYPYGNGGRQGLTKPQLSQK